VIRLSTDERRALGLIAALLVLAAAARWIERPRPIAADLVPLDLAALEQQSRDAKPGDRPAVGSPGGPATLDPNTATPAELTALPGVGPALAARIAAARDTLPFRSAADLRGGNDCDVSSTDRIGDFLVREGLITSGPTGRGPPGRAQSNTRLGFSLVKLGFVPEADLTRALAKQYRVPAVDLDRVVWTRDHRLVPADQALKHLVLPLRRVGRTLTVAMANPTDAGAIDNLKFITRHDIEPVIVGEFTLRKHLDKYYQIKGRRHAQPAARVHRGRDDDSSWSRRRTRTSASRRCRRRSMTRPSSS
jgi:hypothetical protein